MLSVVAGQRQTHVMSDTPPTECWCGTPPFALKSRQTRLHTEVVAPRTIPQDDVWRDDRLVSIPTTKLLVIYIRNKTKQGARESAATQPLMVDIHHRASFRVATGAVSLSGGGVAR